MPPAPALLRGHHAQRPASVLVPDIRHSVSSSFHSLSIRVNIPSVPSRVWPLMSGSDTMGWGGAITKLLRGGCAAFWCMWSWIDNSQRHTLGDTLTLGPSVVRSRGFKLLNPWTFSTEDRSWRSRHLQKVHTHTPADLTVHSQVPLYLLPAPG